MRLAGLLLVLGVSASPALAGELSVRDVFSRATPGTGPGVAYLTIQGGDAADRLLSVSSPRAARVGLHSMVMAGNTMRMREVEGIDVPANGTVALMPNASLHLMLEGLTAPLRRGDQVPLVLRFRDAGERRVEAAVGSPGQAAMPDRSQGR